MSTSADDGWAFERDKKRLICFTDADLCGRARWDKVARNSSPVRPPELSQTGEEL